MTSAPPQRWYVFSCVTVRIIMHRARRLSISVLCTASGQAETAVHILVQSYVEMRLPMHGIGSGRGNSTYYHTLRCVRSCKAATPIATAVGIGMRGSLPFRPLSSTDWVVDPSRNAAIVVMHGHRS